MALMIIISFRKIRCDIISESPYTLRRCIAVKFVDNDKQPSASVVDPDTGRPTWPRKVKKYEICEICCFKEPDVLQGCLRSKKPFSSKNRYFFKISVLDLDPQDKKTLNPDVNSITPDPQQCTAITHVFRKDSLKAHRIFAGKTN
jgi:hypothetical protein